MIIIYMSIHGQDMIAQHKWKILGTCRTWTHECSSSWPQTNHSNTQNQKRKLKKQALTSATVSQFPLTQYPACRCHCHMPQIHYRQNGKHSLLTWQSFRNSGISLPRGRANVDSYLHCWFPHWKIPLSGPCLFKTPAPTNVPSWALPSKYTLKNLLLDLIGWFSMILLPIRHPVSASSSAIVLKSLGIH